MKQLSLIILLFVSCNERNGDLRKIDALSEMNTKKWRIAETDYFVNFGDNFELVDNGFGKEGQKTYTIASKDTALGMVASIEIDEGQELLDRSDDWGTIVGTVQSTLLNRKIFWKVYKTETNRYFAQGSSGGIWVDAFSKEEKGIDSLIAIIATLKQK